MVLCPVLTCSSRRIPSSSHISLRLLPGFCSGQSYLLLLGFLTFLISSKILFKICCKLLPTSIIQFYRPSCKFVEIMLSDPSSDLKSFFLDNQFLPSKSQNSLHSRNINHSSKKPVIFTASFNDRVLHFVPVPIPHLFVTVSRASNFIFSFKFHASSS